jgi:hypothetical protein
MRLSNSPRQVRTPYSGTFTMPAYNWLRSIMPRACDVSGLPRRFVRPQVLTYLSSCSFAN